MNINLHTNERSKIVGYFDKYIVIQSHENN